MKMSCSDIGGEGCSFVAEDENAEDVKRKMYEHAAAKHADKMANMSEEERQQAEKRMDEVLEGQ
jgi:predicted small metal-binding protein